MSGQKQKKEYRKYTVIGYFLMGIFAMILGLAYSLDMEQTTWPIVEINQVSIYMDILPACCVMMVPTISFIHVFFKIRKALYGFDWNRCNESRDIYQCVKNQINTDEEPTLTIIEQYLKKEGKLDTPEAKQLLRWMKSDVRHACFVFSFIYFGVTLAIIIVLVFFIRTGDPYFTRLLKLVVCYSLCYGVAFYLCSMVASHRYFETFSRMSFNVFFPAFLTIGLNMYTGLALARILKEDRLYDYIPFGLFLIFFLLTTVFELHESKKARPNSRKISSFLFTGISFLTGVGCVAILKLFAECIKPMHNLAFSVIIALFFSIFEGWDSVSKMELDNKDPIFTKNIHYLNIMQLVCPCIVFFCCVFVDSQIFNTSFIWAYFFHSLISSFVWIYGNCQPKYTNTKWGNRKLLAGGAAIVLILLSKFYPGNAVKGNSEGISNMLTLVVFVFEFFITYRSKIKIFTPITFNDYSVYYMDNQRGVLCFLFAAAFLAYYILLLLADVLLPQLPIVAVHANSYETLCFGLFFLSSIIYLLEVFYFRHKYRPDKG